MYKNTLNCRIVSDLQAVFPKNKFIFQKVGYFAQKNDLIVARRMFLKKQFFKNYKLSLLMKKNYIE